MRLRTTITAICVSIFLALSALGAEITLYEHSTYYLFTGQNFNVQWDVTSDNRITAYEYELLNVERNNQAFIRGRTPNGIVSVSIPKTGHWILRVRTVWDDAGTEKKTDWCRSDSKDCATVNGQPQSWWIFAWVAPASGLELQ